MLLGRSRVEAALVELLVEDLGDDDFGRGVFAVGVGGAAAAVSGIAFREARWRGEAGRIEEGMTRVDARVDDPDLDSPPGIASTARLRPGSRGVDDLVALTHRRLVQGVVLDA